MKKSQYYEQEKLKIKAILNSISNSLNKINYKISELEKCKKQEESIIQEFGIECYNYNLVNEMVKSKQALVANIESVLQDLNSLKIDDENEINYSIKKINEIGEVLKNTEIKLKAIENEDFVNIQKLQMNAIKKGIYDKFMFLKSEIDRDKLIKKFNKIQNKGFFAKQFDKMFDLEEWSDNKKDNLFLAIQGIDEAIEYIKQHKKPEKEYKIIEIAADVHIYIKENASDSKYRKQMKKIIELEDNINSTFSINNKKLKEEIINKQKSKLPMNANNRTIGIQKERQKIIAYLNKNGYCKVKKEQLTTSTNMENMIKKLNLISKNIYSVKIK